MRHMGGMMTEEFNQTVRALQTHVRTRRQAVRSSESVKTALILPFIRMLGYDVFDPFEVVPGYAHETGGKVDYGIKTDDAVHLVISLSSTPENPKTERAELMAQTVLNSKAPCGILTNGSIHCVYAADSYGVIGREPVLTMDLAGEDVDPVVVSLLHRESFDVAALVALASERRLSGAVAEALAAELADPSRSLMDAIVTRLGEEPTTLRDMIVAAAVGIAPAPAPEPETPAPQEERRQMSEDEEIAYQVVRAIAARDIDPARVVARPGLRYTAVLLDDNHHRAIARLHFNAERAKYIGTFVGRDEKRSPIPGSRGVYGHEDAIRARIAELEAQPREPENEGKGPDASETEAAEAAHRVQQEAERSADAADAANADAPVQ